MFKRRQVACVALLLATSSCGGGDGASGTGTSPISTTPAAPGTGSTTTPSPAYADATDFTRDRSFTGIGLRVLVDRSGAAPTSETRVDPEAAAIGFDFLASTRIYQARYNAESVTAVTQPTATVPPTDQFLGPNSAFTRLNLIVGATAYNALLASTYFGFVRWEDYYGAPGQGSVIRRYILFGARTIASDVPTTGAATFTGSADLSGGPPQGGYGGSDTVVVDYATRTVTGTANFELLSTGGTGSSTRPPTPPEPITLAGSLDPATGRVSGIATHVPTGATGRFEGALYGPRGAEAGLVFAITTADGTLYYGVVGGARS